MEAERARIEALITETEGRMAELDPPPGGRTSESEVELERLGGELKRYRDEIDQMDYVRDTMQRPPSDFA